MDRWWANCNRNESERHFIGQLISDVRSGKMKFTREKYEELLERRKRLGMLVWDEPVSASADETSESEGMPSATQQPEARDQVEEATLD